ncbi:hypothetical protein AgCh_023234 [Apium graveolens]
MLMTSLCNTTPFRLTRPPFSSLLRSFSTSFNLTLAFIYRMAVGMYTLRLSNTTLLLQGDNLLGGGVESVPKGKFPMAKSFILEKIREDEVSIGATTAFLHSHYSL